MFSHLKSRTNAILRATSSDYRLISLALCSHLCTFLIFQHSCFVWFFLPLNYFHLFLCLNELIYIFSPQTLHCYFMPVPLSSTALFVSATSSRAVPHIFTSSAVSLNSHINEEICKKGEPGTNPYLIPLPFRIHFNLTCLCEIPFSSDLLAWQEFTRLLCCSRCSVSYSRCLPNQQFPLPILDAFFHFSPKQYPFLVSLMTANVLQGACFLCTCKQSRTILSTFKTM